MKHKKIEYRYMHVLNNILTSLCFFLFDQDYEEQQGVVVTDLKEVIDENLEVNRLK